MIDILDSLRGAPRPVSLLRSEATLAPPMGELAAPKGQTERVPRPNYVIPILNRGTLSVSLIG